MKYYFVGNHFLHFLHKFSRSSFQLMRVMIDADVFKFAFFLLPTCHAYLIVWIDKILHFSADHQSLMLMIGDFTLSIDHQSKRTSNRFIFFKWNCYGDHQIWTKDRLPLIIYVPSRISSIQSSEPLVGHKSQVLFGCSKMFWKRFTNRTHESTCIRTYAPELSIFRTF